jgi:asparagine synthase (glutamine-hydrolysing)
MSNECGLGEDHLQRRGLQSCARRDELEATGHHDPSNTDTESTMHLYEEEGARCMKRLERMFAFGIWGTRKRAPFLSRDRVGVKPLLRPDAGRVLFGSELKTLAAHPSFTAEMDEESLFNSQTFAFVPTPRTMFRDVHKLAPAERITIKADGTRERDI